MLLKIFSIRDAKTEVFNRPFFQTTAGEAERSFRAALADPKTTLSQYPEDFDLWLLGEFDDNTGQMAPLDTPLHIMKGIQARPKVSAEQSPE